MSEKLICHPNPCTSCPYRRDTPPGVWAREEYLKLPRWDEQWSMAGTFLCHHSTTAAQKSVCRGWMEVHSRNIGVRMALISGRIEHNGIPTEVPLYSSGAEACRAGLKGVKRPSKKASKVIEKLTTARVRKEANP